MRVAADGGPARERRFVTRVRNYAGTVGRQATSQPARPGEDPSKDNTAFADSSLPRYPVVSAGVTGNPLDRECQRSMLVVNASSPLCPRTEVHR